MPSAEFGQVTNYTTRCRYSNILESANSGEGKRLPLPSLKYRRTEGKVSFLPVEDQREESKIGIFANGDGKEVPGVNQILKGAGQREAEVLLFMGKGQGQQRIHAAAWRKRALSQLCFPLSPAHLWSKARDHQLAGMLFLRAPFQARNPFSTSSEHRGTVHLALAFQLSGILPKLISSAMLQHLPQRLNPVQVAGPRGGAEGPPVCSSMGQAASLVASLHHFA